MVAWLNRLVSLFLRSDGLLATLGGERVGEGSANGNSGSDNSVALHGLLEDNRRDNDDNDSLGSVQDRRSDGTDMGGEGKGEFVVKVKANTRNENIHNDGLGTMFGDSGIPRLLQSRKLVDDDEWDGAAKGDDVHDGVHVGSVHVLGFVSLEGLGDGRSKLSLQGSGSIGQGCVCKGFHVNIYTLSFLDAREADTSNDRDEHGVGKHGLEVHWWDKDSDDGGKGRFTGLDDLRETDGTDSGGQDGTAVSETGEETDRHAGSPVSGSEIWGLAETSSPHDKTPYDTNNQLSASNSPMSVDHVGSSLIVDVVERVTGVPSKHQHGLLWYGSSKGIAQWDVWVGRS
jgi:hypothetical protein